MQMMRTVLAPAASCLEEHVHGLTQLHAPGHRLSRAALTNAKRAAAQAASRVLLVSQGAEGS